MRENNGSESGLFGLGLETKTDDSVISRGKGQSSARKDGRKKGAERVIYGLVDSKVRKSKPRRMLLSLGLSLSLLLWNGADGGGKEGERRRGKGGRIKKMDVLQRMKKSLLFLLAAYLFFD